MTLTEAALYMTARLTILDKDTLPKY